jgi:hypothetical protein
MSNIKWKFNDGDITFISPADRFDDHVRKFSAKFGLSKYKITILENGNDQPTNTNDLVESSPASDPWDSTVPKRTRSRSLKSETSELPDLSGYVGESDSTLNTMVDPACDSGDSESGDGGAH